MIAAKKLKNSAFDQGQKAGADRGGVYIANPFTTGSSEHNNFEVGRRFGAKSSDPVARWRPEPAPPLS